MNKSKTKSIAIWSISAFVFIASGLAASIAWFDNPINSISPTMTGSVVEEYFHCGDGSEGDPFVITRPIHYYHLVEFFQRKTALPIGNDETADFGSDYLYFQVGYDIDDDGDLEVYEYDDQGIPTGDYETTLNMAYYSGENALLPIGTDEVPFIGVFDGMADEGIKVSNLHIHCTEDVEIKEENQQGETVTTEVTRTASDIGIFGYVADHDSSSNPTIIQNAKFDGLTIDLSDAPETPATSDAGHVTTHSGDYYVGLVAGHVHSYTNYSSTGPTNASPLHDVYVTNATVKGGAGFCCNYGYIGKVDTNDGSTPTSLGTIIDTHAYAEGPGNDWGGSINMLELNQRLYHYLNLSSVTSMKLNTTGSQYSSSSNQQRRHRWISDSSADWAYSVYSGNENSVYKYYNTDPTSISGSGNLIYRLVGKSTGRSGYAISTNSDSNQGSLQSNITVPGSFFPLNIDEDYSTLEKNTGYIASAGNDGASTVRTAAYGIQFIGNSLSSSGTGSTAYTSSQFEVLTNGTVAYNSSAYRRISDSYNKDNTNVSSVISGYSKTVLSSSLKKYNSSRAKMDSILKDQSSVHGLHFQGTTINKGVNVSIPHAKINESDVAGLVVPTSSVDFSVKESGIINFFAGSYYNTTGTNADSFFSLHSITRSGASLSTIKEISKIYANKDPATKDDYPHVYLYKGNSPEYSTGTADETKLEFDMQYLWNAPPEANAVYYFEIPVNSGEYALGSVSTDKTKGAYLMYLDIAASASKTSQDEDDEIKEKPLFTQIDFQTSLNPSDNHSFVINSCFNVAYVIPAGATKDNFSITISCSAITVVGKARKYPCYEIVIVNESGNSFTISCLLSDDNSDPEDDYYCKYAILYNEDHGGTRTEYSHSNTYVGASNGSSMAPPSS